MYGNLRVEIDKMSFKQPDIRKVECIELTCSTFKTMSRLRTQLFRGEKLD